MKPWEFNQFTLAEFSEYYQQQMKKQEDEFKINERLLARFMCLFANANRDTKKQRRPYKIEDFITGEKKKQTPEQMANILKALTIGLGGEIKDG